ncbi:MAG: hypothetical protein ACRD29_08985 [Acidimicrobiales bacterium]
MFKRLFWLMVGTGFGFGMAVLLMRVARETAQRYAPQRVSSDVAQAVRRFGQDVKVAVAEGRHAMRERETELRAAADVGGNGDHR